MQGNIRVKPTPSILWTAIKITVAFVLASLFLGIVLPWLLNGEDIAVIIGYVTIVAIPAGVAAYICFLIKQFFPNIPNS
jgi:CHASE2 domain-containing sensor protein